MTSRPDIPVVKLAAAAAILGLTTRAAESALRRAGISSGYPLGAVQWLRDHPGPGQGARTDLNPKETAVRWTLETDAARDVLTTHLRNIGAHHLTVSRTGRLGHEVVSDRRKPLAAAQVSLETAGWKVYLERDTP